VTFSDVSLNFCTQPSSGVAGCTGLQQVTGSAGTATANSGAFPLTVTSGEKLGLALDVNIPNAIIASGQTISAVNLAAANVLTATALQAPSSTTDLSSGQLAHIDDLYGVVSNVSASAQSFTLQTAYRGAVSITANSSTTYDPVCSAQTFSCVTSGALAAVDAVLGVVARLRPSMLEFMDSVAINAVEDTLRMDLDRGAAAMLVAGSDERGRASGEDASVIAEVFAENGATEVFSTDDPDEGEAFVAARRFCIPAVEAKGSLLLEDVGVPLPALGQLVTGIARIAADRDLMISVIAHAGDGNTHPLIVYDPADTAMTERAHVAFGEIMDLAVGLGGTITGEHGVGRLKRPWLDGYLGPEAMDLNRRIKQALDPHGILNPGAAI